ALPGERERCLQAGMNSYLSKPFKAHELFAVVEGWDTPEPAPGGIATQTDDAGPPVDLVSFRAMLTDAGIESAGDQMLHVFVDHSSERAGPLRHAADRGDFTEVERIAHSLKSSSGTIMAGGLADKFKKLEAAAQAADAALVQQLSATITIEHERVVAFLRAHLST
ncbi:MAG: response regulator, partial [Gemmatimonadota bacterium]